MKPLKISLLALLFACFIPWTAKAQTSGSAGLVLGVSNESVRITHRFLGFETVYEGRENYGYAIGIYGQGWYGPAYMRPELTYQFNGGQIWDENSSNDFRIHKLEMPIMFGVKAVGPFCLELGPTLGYVLYSTRVYDNNAMDLAKLGIGYRLGVGLQFNRMFLNLAYQAAVYNAGEYSDRTTFREPYKVGLNVGIQINN
jgi:hypothetical protein